ncbi:Aste57867_8151 [Aphanomyces stellatus]|uniref:Aste57867_8151 protein n=1 Tax=Aphanomyces stellatus TaxID=120398 RepID=A0A485KJM0_9STRA|nr:hypothetical protein As57867_008121 [Aphanomyces stellatus]VFT85040.1 Aste57867_8151 [Aphanomyces stellatus]
MATSPYLTVEDLKMCFSLFCCVYGIGTLGMPGNYARAGYAWASVALVYMALVNIYATVCISKVLLVAPPRVRTFADLGDFCLGPVGRWLILVTQMLTCVLVPIAFLVLGGIMLTTLFPSTYGMTTWIIIMGVVLLPVCLIPTLKEGALAAAAGCLGTILADGIALYLLVDNMTPIPPGLHTPDPALTFKSVATIFGNLALAYGAGIVIPALQRQHSQPKRMPRVIVVTLTTTSILFLLVAITGVSVVGCQIPGNLLFAVAGSSLGFTASRGGVVLAFLAMQLHVTIAFGVLITPGFYILERCLLGVHQQQPHVLESLDENDVGREADAPGYDELDTPRAPTTTKHDPNPVVDRLAEHHNTDTRAYQEPGVYPKVAALRIVILAGCVAIACAWKDRLLDLLDFTGASCIALSCMVLPIVFYLRHFGAAVSWPERLWAYTAIIVSLFLAVYVSVVSAQPLFSPNPTPPVTWDNVKFPYCPSTSSYARIVYTNVSYHAHFP